MCFNRIPINCIFYSKVISIFFIEKKMYYKIILINRHTENIYKNINVRKKITEIRSAYIYKERKEDRRIECHPFFYFHCCISQLLESQNSSSYFLIQQRVNNKAMLFYI